MEFDNSDPKPQSRPTPGSSLLTARIIDHDVAFSGLWPVTTASTSPEDPSYHHVRSGRTGILRHRRCRVVQIAGTYYLTFTEVSEHGVGVGLRRHYRLAQPPSTRHDPPPQKKDCAIFGEQIGGKYYALPPSQQSGPGRDYIWIAESRDLEHWGRHRCLAHSRPGKWDNARVGAGAAPYPHAGGLAGNLPWRQWRTPLLPRRAAVGS